MLFPPLFINACPDRFALEGRRKWGWARWLIQGIGRWRRWRHLRQLIAGGKEEIGEEGVSGTVETEDDNQGEHQYLEALGVGHNYELLRIKANETNIRNIRADW